MGNYVEKLLCRIVISPKTILSNSTLCAVEANKHLELPLNILRVDPEEMPQHVASYHVLHNFILMIFAFFMSKQSIP